MTIMTRIVRSALLPYPATNLFDLVNDVARYPEFLPWCASAEVMTADASTVVAALTIEQGRIRERLVTCNRLSFPERIELSLVEGPFRRLAGFWSFTKLGDAGCKVELELEFEMHGVVQKAFSGIFGRAAGSLVDAFCERARALYR
jgi:ribosome-associated toxin RatA of RatAB toxin-antitoxin module